MTLCILVWFSMRVLLLLAYICFSGMRLHSTRTELLQDLLLLHVKNLVQAFGVPIQSLVNYWLDGSLLVTTTQAKRATWQGFICNEYPVSR